MALDLFFLSISLNAFLKSASTAPAIFFLTSEWSISSTAHLGFPAFFARLSMALITGAKLSCPNLTASSITFSDNPEVSDSTIRTASLVPATTRSSSEASNSFGDGFSKYFPSL